MRRLILELEVDNALELVRQEKGRFAGILAKYMMRPDKVRDKVEDKIAEEMVKHLKPKILETLGEKHVRARVNIKLDRSTLDDPNLGRENNKT